MLAGRAPAWLGDWVYAHRGLHAPDGALENSLPAFQAALDAGFGMECDVQASADGQAMVFHDWTLDRLTAEGGNVRDRAAEELTRVKLAQDSGAIPLLKDLLTLVRGRAPILVEIKSRSGVDWHPIARATATAIAEYRGPVVTMSFDPRIVRWMRRHLPHHAGGLVAGRREWKRMSGIGGFTAYRALATGWANPDFLACDLADLPDPFVTRLRKRGLPILGWTVRTPALAARAARCCDAPIAEGAGLP